MFRKIDDFKESWLTESKFTQSIFDALTDESLSQAINSDHRTIGRLAWHICDTISEMLPHIGLKFERVEQTVPKNAKVIAQKYSELSKSLLSQIGTWTDEQLLEEKNLYGESWKNGATLLILIKHEIHHRGQLTVLMRQAGLTLPSMYGPTKEGWKEYNAEPPAI